MAAYGVRAALRQPLNHPHQQDVRRQHQEDGADDAAGGGLADAFRAAFGIQAVPAAGDADQVAEHQRLERGRDDVAHLQLRQAGVPVAQRRQRAAERLGQEAATQRQEGDEHGQQRQRQNAGQHARPDQLAQRRQAEHFEGVELFGQLHGAEFGGQAGAGAAGHDQAGTSGRELQHHRQRQGLRQHRLGAEALAARRAGAARPPRPATTRRWRPAAGRRPGWRRAGGSARPAEPAHRHAPSARRAKWLKRPRFSSQSITRWAPGRSIRRPT